MNDAVKTPEGKPFMDLRRKLVCRTSVRHHQEAFNNGYLLLMDLKNMQGKITMLAYNIRILTTCLLGTKALLTALS